MKHPILLIEPTIQPVGVAILQRSCEVFMAPDDREETLIPLIQAHQIEGVITRVEKISRRVIASCPSLRVIEQHGVGMDKIDIAAATEHGVKVLNVPDGNYTSVAEHIILSVLTLSRNLLLADQAVCAGNWRYRETNIPHEVAGKNLFLVGLGIIGKDAAKKALAFQMRVTAFDPYISREEMAALGVEKIDTLEDGLREADFLSLQVHLTPETKGLISREHFAQMKKTLCFINISRGAVVDQRALYDALKTGQIASASLDVFDPEPPEEDEPLFTLPNVILTPHVAGDTYGAKQRISKTAAEMMIRALDGEATYNWQNRAAMEAAGLK